jgi:CMP-N,N'-diacetyllegionaminic acid synthase
MESMKILIVGYGSIGKRHARILSSCFGEDVCVVTSQKQSKYQQYQSLLQITELSDFDYFVIATETARHFEDLRQLTMAVQHKKILVEKPIFDDRYLDRLNELSIGQNQVYTAYYLRFHPVLVELKSRLQGQRILHINIITGQYLPSWRPDRDYTKTYSADPDRGGGVLLDLSHELDYLQWLCGGPLIHLAASSKKISNLEIRSDDFFSAIGVTEQGTQCTLTLDYLSRISIKHILVHTDNATYRGDLVNGTLEVGDDQMQQNLLYSEKPTRDSSFEAMHRAILSGSDEQVCDYHQGVQVLKTISDARISQEQRSW